MAREYVLLATQFDQQVHKKGEPVEYHRYRRGDTLTLSNAEADRLLAAKAVKAVPVDEIEVDEDATVGEAEGSAYTEPVAVSGEEPAAPVLEPISEPATPPEVVAAAPERPKNVATKPVWEAYAIERGIEGAKSMSKDELVTAIDALDAQS